MSKIYIDELLHFISPSLVSKYEKIHLPKDVTLRQVNQAFKAKEKKYRILYTYLVSMALITFTLMILVIFIGALYGYNIRPVAFVMVVIILISTTIVTPIRVAMSKVSKKLDSSGSILRNFQGEVESMLQEVSENLKHEYTEVSIKKLLVYFARDIIEHEIHIKITYLNSVGIDSVSLSFDTTLLKKLQEKLKCSLEAAEIGFGLKFDRRELFAEAEKKLEQPHSS